MFKRIEYAGFDRHPDLRVRVEAAVPVIADELGDSDTEVSVTFRVRDVPAGPPVLEVEFADDTYGGRTDEWDWRTFNTERDIRSRGRAQYMRILSHYLAGRARVYQKRLAEPVEG